MEAIEFKIQGKMAHFRKYYSNSTALSYHVPPVATVKGMIAGLLGYERDSYYDIFSNEKCKVAIAVTAPLKKITQTMNLMKVEKPSDLAGSGVHSQNNTEWIIPENIRTDNLEYRIVFWHEDETIMDNLMQCIGSEEIGYRSNAIALALGSAQCQGWVTGGSKISIEEVEAGNKEEVISTCVAPTDKILGVRPYAGRMTLKKEESITDFSEERCLTENSKKDIIVPVDGKAIKYILKAGSRYWKDTAGNITIFITE